MSSSAALDIHPEIAAFVSFKYTLERFEQIAKGVPLSSERNSELIAVHPIQQFCH